MYNIAVLGDKDSITGFASLGLSVFPVEEREQAKQLIKTLAANNYGIIYITEELAEKVYDEIEKYKFKSKPAIILIPGIKGNTNRGLDDVTKSVEKAVGSNILK